ncbi:hypothetical protein BCR33DRAFT_714204 [Rhizoclosmatium globosum]|uniref:Uncharacterized protein n=1 Tax=Rhizoclosmatium globosum TaxID=329046 RepID=A0A1Y2CQ48_9FUNG|nr:hypothetical protein BCR33DRAFT_714204 [Rhizoclosmatium globosum]|eukprot:ORY49168.1 hypothetical protein BCR33DRAFT_714204 [Rhizoclosmatium globosum]
MNVCMIAFETSTMGIYMYYLRIVDENVIQVQKLRILSRFGIASCVVLVVWLTSVDLYFFWSVTVSVPESEGEIRMDIVLRIYDLGPLVYLLIQLAMKYSLLKEQVKEESERRERIVTARITTGLDQSSTNDIQDRRG